MNNDIEKTIEWMQNAYQSIADAGGQPQTVISSIPVDVMAMFIRNNIHLNYKAPTQ